MIKEDGYVFCNKEQIKDSILWESKNFFVKVGIGIFTPGHVMIISKDHLSCFGELPDRSDDEFIQIKNEVFNKLKVNFSEPMIYEHGAYSQSVNHAHIHFIPKKSDFYSVNNLNKKIFRKLRSKEVDDIFEIRNVFKKDGSYIYLEEDGRKWVYITKGLPELKFTFRKEFARLTGLKKLSDWSTISGEFKKKNKEWVRLTKEKLKVDVIS